MTEKTNKDGFAAGQTLSHEDLMAMRAKRLQKPAAKKPAKATEGADE